MIGGNIILNPTHFLGAFDAGNDLAVHTWSHPHMTALSNADVVAEVSNKFTHIVVRF
jgi:chitin deacetylase